ncbi:hypothetical protein RND71_034454 [Anisodus tanguticus]|uniref:Protein kinase domain-containing protein n=1 Tax=Anisodus tanguticus TaxID=243964 RepID=A0AAE1V513_9SOLA|nr:hypothetical protein RND71_034454 [Anisodus tanguticus]
MKLIRSLMFFVLYFGSAMGQLPSQDILALLEFKKGIKYDPTGFVVESWNEESIDFNRCPSSWNGIMCNGGNVAAVVLVNLGLFAHVDLTVFANLIMLVKLSMANNSIAGEMPNNIANFNSLECLDLSGNLFTSSLPPDVGKLGSLKNMSLAGNNFSGPIPDTILGLKSVQSLDLSHNSFSEPVPSSLMKLTGLVYLNLSVNGFTKKSPKVDLSENLLVNFASEQQKFLPGISETVQYLNLSHYRLRGSLVSEARIFGNLKILDLSYNQCSISMITSTTLHTLNLSSNALYGELPFVIWKFGVLDLSKNRFEELHLQNNALVGSIDFSRPPSTSKLCVLDLSHNQLTGYFPDGFGSLTAFQVLDISGNNFSGSVPTSMGNVSSLTSLDISENHFTGSGQASSDNHKSRQLKTIIKVVIIVACVVVLVIIILLAIFVFYLWASRKSQAHVSDKDIRYQTQSNPSVLAAAVVRNYLGPQLKSPWDILQGNARQWVALDCKMVERRSGQQRKEFTKVAKKFANIRHPNVVGLRYYYWGPTQHEKLILSDYISPRSLASFLYATNILLDSPDLNAKVVDYCLHRLLTQAGTIEQILDASVLGYRAPELAASKKPLPSFKSDVYAFGVNLLELLTGKCADGGVDLTDWVTLKVAEGGGSDCFDNGLSPQMGNPAFLQ